MLRASGRRRACWDVLVDHDLGRVVPQCRCRSRVRCAYSRSPAAACDAARWVGGVL